MSDETLLTAAHRMLRFFRTDARVGFTSDDLHAAERTCEAQIGLAEKGAAHDAAVLAAARTATVSLFTDESQHGGVISIRSQIAFDQLDKAIRGAGGRRAQEAVA